MVKFWIAFPVVVLGTIAGISWAVAASTPKAVLATGIGMAASGKFSEEMIKAIKFCIWWREWQEDWDGCA